MHLELLRVLEDREVSSIDKRHYKHVVGNTTANSIEAHESLSDVD